MSDSNPGMTPEEVRDMEHRHVKMSYNQIEENLFAGNNLCCATHFEQELLSKGITADISLEIENIDSPKGARYFFWFPWLEDTAPPKELIYLALKTLDNLMAHDVKAYVHCKNGHGRTSTFLAAYFISRKNMTTDEALTELWKKRPSGHIKEVQKEFLRAFELEYRKETKSVSAV